MKFYNSLNFKVFFNYLFIFAKIKFEGETVLGTNPPPDINGGGSVDTPLGPKFISCISKVGQGLQSITYIHSYITA